MRNSLFTVIALLGCCVAAVAGQPPVVATKPNVQSPARAQQSPAVAYAERDVARLKQLAAKDKKFAGKLANVETRLQALRNDKSGGKADPKYVQLVDAFTHNRPLISCRWSADGRFVFAGAMDAALHRYDGLTGDRVDLPGHESWVRRFALHRSGSMLVSGSYAGKLLWWTLGEEPRDFPSTSGTGAVPMARQGIGKAKDSPKSLGSVGTLKPVRVVEAHQGFVRGVAISPDGKLVASGGNDNVVRLWSAADGKLVRELSGHARHVYNVKFDPTGRFLVSGDLMGILKQWDVATGKLVRDLDAKVLSKYDKTFMADCGGIRGMDFSPDGKYLVVSGIGEVTNAFAGVGKPTAVLFDFPTGKQLRVMKPAKNFRGTLWSVKWHPTENWFVGVGGGNAGMMWFWRPDSAKSFHEIKLKGSGYDVDVHPDGLRIAVAQYNRNVTIFDLAPVRAKPQATRKPGRKRRRKK